MYSKLQKFLPAIKNLNPSTPLTKSVLMTEQFLIEKEGGLDMYYAPHNEYINKQAIIVIVGITPGWNQMKTAFEQFINGLNTDHPVEQILKEVKKAASFSGAMRSNLIQMLDECGIPEAAHVEHSASLFEENRHLLHTTSVIKYPVFYKGKNYTGHQPSIEQSSLLSKHAFDVFPKEISQMQQSALLIPLGKTVEQVFHKLFREGKLANHYCLFGFPHPSGANGHRKKQFLEQKNSLIASVKEWARYRQLQ